MPIAALSLFNPVQRYVKEIWLVGLVVLLACFVASESAARLGLLVFGTTLVVLPGIWNEQRMGAHWLAGVLAVALLVMGVKDDVRNLTDSQVRVWNVYHYYLGSKYFSELGYNDLYVASLAADREGQNYWTDRVKEVRDLETYEFISVEMALANYQASAHFTADRWKTFKTDVAALAKHRKAKNWRMIFRDRGYNGTPLWTAVGGGLSHWVSADSPWLIALCSFDLLALFCACALLWRAFGMQALLVLLLFVASPTNIARMVGGFMQLDWLVAIVASVALLRTGRPGLAGIAMAYALMTRAFPVVLLAAFGLPVLRELLHTRRIPREAVVYGGAIVLACAVMFLISLANGRGIEAWPEFVQAIGLHSGDHVLGERRIGLEHLFTVDFSQLGTVPDKLARGELLIAHQPVYWLSCVVLLSGLGWVAWRCSPQQAQLLGIVALFVVMVLSRYYYGILALMPLLSTDPRVSRYVVGGQLTVFALHAYIAWLGAEWHTQYVAINAMLLVYFSLLLVWLRCTTNNNLTMAQRVDAGHGHKNSETEAVVRPGTTIEMRSFIRD